MERLVRGDTRGVLRGLIRRTERFALLLKSQPGWASPGWPRERMEDEMGEILNEMIVLEYTGQLPKEFIYEAPVVEKVKPVGGYDFIYQRPSSGSWLCFRVKMTVEEFRMGGSR